jgi:hypothetical protein
MNNSDNTLDNLKVNLPNYGKKDLSKYLLFFFLPFTALGYSLKNFRLPNSKYLFWFFCIYFGFVFVIPEDIHDASDSARYASQLISSNLSYFSFGQLVEVLYNPVNGYPDIYQQIVTWIIANFTDDPRWLFATFAAVFGYFFMQNLWILFENIKINVNFVILLFIIAFALVNPIWNINGVRMWTAAQIYLYGNLVYFMRGKQKGIIWVIASILFHFSFLFPIILFLVYILIPKRDIIFFMFFIIASFVNEIDLDLVKESLSLLPEMFQVKLLPYLNPDYILEASESKINYSLHVVMAAYLNKWFIYIWVIFLFINRNESFANLVSCRKLFNFGLFLGGWAQIASLFGTGGRFLILSDVLFYFVITLVLTKLNLNVAIKKLAHFSIPILLFIIIFNIRVGLDYIGILLFFGNPMIALTFDHQIPLIQYFKSIF